MTCDDGDLTGGVVRPHAGRDFTRQLDLGRVLVYRAHMTTPNGRRPHPGRSVVDIDKIKELRDTVDPMTGRTFTQRAIGRKLGVTESAVSVALSRDRRRGGAPADTVWARELPWHVPRREMDQYIYKHLVYWLQRRAGQVLPHEQESSLRQFEEKLGAPRFDAPMGAVLYWSDERDRWVQRPRQPNDGPEPYVRAPGQQP